MRARGISSSSSDDAAASSSANSGGGSKLQLHQLPIRTNNTNNNSSTFGAASSLSPDASRGGGYGNNNNNNSSSGASLGGPPPQAPDHRHDVEFAHQQTMALIDRNRQWYEAEIARRESYIDQLQTDYRHNLSVAQEHQGECERLRLEVEELNRELTNSEETVKRLAETNGALSETNSRIKAELDESQRKAEHLLQKAKTDAHSSIRGVEAESARRDGEARAREAALQEEHERAVLELKQQSAEMQDLLNARISSLEQERTQLEDKVSSLERKNSSLTSDKTSLSHSLAISRKREEELENRLREASRKCDSNELELSRLRDENISLSVDKDSRTAEWQTNMDAQGRSHMERISHLTAECKQLSQSEKGLKELVESLKSQLEHERSVRRKENDEADQRILALKKDVDSAREAAADSAQMTHKELHEERRRLMEELNDQLAETLKQTRRADDLDRKVTQSGFELSLSKQRIDALSAELSSQRELFRADTLKLQQLHQEDSERWNEEGAKLRRNLAASEDARNTLEQVIQDHVDREKKDALMLSERESLQARVQELQEENEKIRQVVREVTNDMQSDTAIIDSKKRAEKIVVLEAELARAKNQGLELDVRLQATEQELREERRENDARKQQFSETVKNLSSDAAQLRQMLQAERQRKSHFVGATLAGVSKWTAQATTSGGGAELAYNNNNSGPHPDGSNNDNLEADAAAANLADRLDTQALHHELSRLELVVSSQQKQLSELISQRAQHVAQIADLRSMFEAVSQDRQSLVDVNNALRTEARAAEAEVTRLKGENGGLRQALVKVRGQSALDRVRSPNREQQQQQQQHQHQHQMMTRTTPAATAGNVENSRGAAAAVAGRASNGKQQQQPSAAQTSARPRASSVSSTGGGGAPISTVYGRPVLVQQQPGGSSNNSNYNNNGSSRSNVLQQRR